MKLYRAGGSGVAVVMCAMSLLIASSSNAQINSWISPTSGNWEDPSWLLGQLPGVGQTILLTNAGWKAVEIRQATAVNFPQSLAVDSITISSPTNTVNTLLLNFVGTGSPLVANSITLNENSVITMHSSALIVRSNISIGGTFNQNDFSGVTASTMHIGDIGPATYTMSDGTLTVTNLEMLGGAGYWGIFDQEGGFHYATPLVITNAGGEYDLHGGQLGGDIQIKHGILVQYGGDLAPSNFSDQGSYTLLGGTVEAPNGLTMTDNAFAAQFGGTNSSASLVMGSTNQEDQTGGVYTMVDGVINLTSATINYLGDLDQQGGSITITGSLNIPDFLFGPPPVHSVWGNYTIEGGTMTAGSINLAGHISQRGGTNTVTGNLNLQDGPADYILNGGLLSTSNTLKNAGAFHQTNGIHSVQKVLHIDNPLAYDMAGGQLIAPDIEIENSTFAHYGGAINNATVLAMNAGSWIERTPSVQLGGLRLFGDSSTLSFGTNPCIIRFLASSGQVWSNNAALNVGGWSGSLNGGGQSQIYVGNNSSGLSAKELAHIQFTFSQGNLPAKILPTGELVPVVTGLPFYPTDLTATSVATNRIDLQWTDNAINEYGYSIERSLDGSNFVQLCAPPANATNYSDTDVSAGTTYYYRAQAQNTNGNSDFSNIASATTKFHAPIAGMIAWWKADGSTEDSIGTHNAILPLGSEASYATGVVHQAFDFPGLGARVRVPYSPDLIQTNAFTVEGWIHPSQSTNGIIAQLGDFLPQHNSWTLHMTNNPGHLSFVIDSDVNSTAEIQAPVQTNQWQHFAATFNATNGMKLYINGALAAQTNGNILPVSFLNAGEEAYLGIGSASVISNYFPFIGLVDEVALYSRALSAAEIQSIYNAGASGKLAVTPVAMALSSQTNGTIQLNFGGPMGRSFEFDISTDMVHWTPWKTQLNGSGTMLINDETATNTPMRFYRTTLLP